MLARTIVTALIAAATSTPATAAEPVLLQLAPGKNTYAIIKASSVMVAVD
jgi:molybdopterin-binding protein